MVSHSPCDLSDQKHKQTVKLPSNKLPNIVLHNFGVVQKCVTTQHTVLNMYQTNTRKAHNKNSTKLASRWYKSRHTHGRRIKTL